MRLLVLGGTRFLGRALVESALARGHELTLFNRGQTNAELFPETEKIRGDRTLDLSPLDGREWDAVLDVATFLPRAVRRSVEALAGRVGRYVYVSSISAYADQSTPPVEGAPVAELDDRDAEDIEHYGALKAACEQIVVDAFGERALVVRPGLIVGPHDPTDRFTYWPRRVAEGGRVLAPAPPDQPVQFIDVRDLADWIVSATEEQLDGLYNATGDTISFEQLLDECRRVSGDAEIVWVPSERLVARRRRRVDGAPALDRHAGVLGDAPHRRVEGEAGGAPLQAAGRDDRGHARVGRRARDSSRGGRRADARAGTGVAGPCLSGTTPERR